jgi:steroid 5-alpha reductase family enzyme
MLTTHLITIFIFFTLIYIVALIKKDFSIVDITWGIGFLIVMVIGQIYLKKTDTRSIILSLMVLVWALRLSIYLFIRSKGRDEDFRYKKMRTTWGEWANIRAYFQIFILQGIILLIISSPIIFILENSNSPLKESDFFGIIIFFIGLFFESIADYQVMKFKSNPANKGEILMEGLWKYSRHPNYFGEFLIWWGIFFLSMADGPVFYSLIGPLVLTFLLMKVSGVPMLEEKYKGNAEYLSYQKRTNAFFPWFPKN